MTAIPDGHTSAPPTSPNIAIRRGTRPEVYMR
jgi:hypothetical protein